MQKNGNNNETTNKTMIMLPFIGTCWATALISSLFQRDFKLLNESEFLGYLESAPKVALVDVKQSLRKRCPYSELFWSVFSRSRT